MISRNQALITLRSYKLLWITGILKSRNVANFVSSSSFQQMSTTLLLQLKDAQRPNKLPQFHRARANMPPPFRFCLLKHASILSLLSPRTIVLLGLLNALYESQLQIRVLRDQL